jgi:hypothetical protein
MENNIEIGKDSQMSTTTGTGMNQSHGKQYFTPDISDIRVGYECEAIFSNGKWHPFKYEEHDFSVLEIEILNKQIRVPYLTKEQIEAEGWVYSEEESKDSNICEWWDKGDWSLIMWWGGEGGIAEIDNHDKIDFSYRGVCKCINDFRYICKLLNIK